MSRTAPELRKPKLQLFEGLIPGNILYSVSCLSLQDTVISRLRLKEIYSEEWQTASCRILGAPSSCVAP